MSQGGFINLCGIAGIITKTHECKSVKDKIERMTNLIRYRGPDAEGFYYDKKIAFGHRRLSIIDLNKNADQPFTSENNEYCIVYNGEVYNYKELREELISLGHKFTTTSDTEVVLRSYIEWEEGCAERFNGMWAFAIYDKPKNRIFLSRDRFGIKPFYYTDMPNYFAFCSEIKGIVGVFGELREVNESYMHYFLTSPLLDDGEETFFKDVKSLSPAHNAVYDLNNGSLKITRYWTVNREAFYEKYIMGRDVYEGFNALLESSVSLHMRSDVPVGSCLSGGLDSSTLVGLACNDAKGSMYTFSGVFNQKEYNEQKYIKEINSAFNTQPEIVFPDAEDDLFEVLKTITWHQDGPTAGPGLYTQFAVMQKAHNYVKVVLDGQGSDELLGGYIYYFNTYIADLIATGKQENIKIAKKLKIDVYKYWGTTFTYTPTLYSRLKSAFRMLYGRSKASAAAIFPQKFNTDFINRANENPIKREPFNGYPLQIDNVLHNQLVSQSIPALLHHEDRNSSAFSIEARVPYLDYRIVEFALALPIEYKLHGNWTKWILRKSAERFLPKDVVWRRSKLGYTTPFAIWLCKKDNPKKAKELLISFADRGLVNGFYMDALLKDHLSGKTDASWELYRYLSTELFYQIFIDSFTPCAALN